MNSNTKSIIFFDGVCNLCNNTIQYIIKNDKRNYFYFAPLQGNTAKITIAKHHINTSEYGSIILVSKGKVYSKSTAILKIAFQMGFPRNLSTAFFIIPVFIRNKIYDFVAKNRYKWYGKRNNCMRPTTELKEKFLD